MLLLLSMVSCGPEVTLEVALPPATHGIQRSPADYVLVRDTDPCDALRRQAAPADWGLLLVQVTPTAISVWDQDGWRQVVHMADGTVPESRGMLIAPLYDELLMWREHQLEQEVLCGTPPQDELLLAVDPGVPTNILNAVRYTAGQARYPRQALWVDSPTPRPDPGEQSDDVLVQVYVKGDQVQARAEGPLVRGDDPAALALQVLGQAPDCARLIPVEGTRTGELVAVMDPLSGAGARVFDIVPASDAMDFQVADAAPAQTRTWSLTTPIAVLPLHLPFLAGLDYVPTSACDPVDVPVPEPAPLAVDPLMEPIRHAAPNERLQACYETLLLTRPDASGTLRFAVELEGSRVTDVRVVEDEIGDPELAECTTKALSRMRPTGIPAGTHQVVLPFTFIPR